LPTITNSSMMKRSRSLPWITFRSFSVCKRYHCVYVSQEGVTRRQFPLAWRAYWYENSSGIYEMVSLLIKDTLRKHDGSTSRLKTRALSRTILQRCIVENRLMLREWYDQRSSWIGQANLGQVHKVAMKNRDTLYLWDVVPLIWSF